MTPGLWIVGGFAVLQGIIVAAAVYTAGFALVVVGVCLLNMALLKGG